MKQGKVIKLPGDAIAAVTGGVSAIPDGMACGIMAGLDPIQGIYSTIFGHLVGSWTTSAVYMSVTTTSALALATGSALYNIPPEDKLSVVTLITFIAGLIQVIMSFFRVDVLLRFVSNAVMRGFLSGIAIQIILGQIPDFTGYYISEETNRVIRAADIFLHPTDWNWWIFASAALTLIIIIVIRKTPLKVFSMFLALLIVNLLSILFDIEELMLVGEASRIPKDLPIFHIPDYLHIPDFILSALAIAMIGFIQGAGVSQIRPNPDGNYPDESKDLRGQGLANIFIGFFSGIPVGGSVSSSTLMYSAGARSRWGYFLAGVIIALLVFTLGWLIEKIPLGTLAAILIVTGYDALNKKEIATIWKTSLQSRTVMLFSFITTLVLPIQYAVLLSIVLTFFLHVIRSSNTIKLKSIEPEGEWYRQTTLPDQLESYKVLGIIPYGSLFFAGAFALKRILPTTVNAKNPVVIFILRGKEEVGSTFIKVIKAYNDELKSKGGKLILVGVSENVYQQLERTGTIEQLGHENVHLATKYVGKIFRQVWEEEQEWVKKKKEES
ncbi:MAG TPA: SulP family inorganic anion transporter [Cytophagaceae bacterium]